MLFALVVWLLTTNLFQHGAPLLLLNETPPTFEPSLGAHCAYSMACDTKKWFAHPVRDGEESMGDNQRETKSESNKEGEASLSSETERPCPGQS